MGWSSKYKSQGKSNTSRGKHHTLLQIVMLSSHSCSKLQKKKHLEFGKKGCNWGSWVEVTKQIPGCQGTLTRSPSLIIVAACIGNGFSLQGNETYVFSVKHLVPTIPPWCSLEEKSGFGFHFLKTWDPSTKNLRSFSNPNYPWVKAPLAADAPPGFLEWFSLWCALASHKHQKASSRSNPTCSPGLCDTFGMNNAKWFWDPASLEQGFTCFASPPFKGQSYRKAAEHHHLFVFGSPNCGGNTRCANSSSRSWSPEKNFTGRFNWKQQNSKATNY